MRKPSWRRLERNHQLSWFGRSVVEHDVKQRRMNRSFSVVLDEAQLPEFVHKEAYPGPGRSDHLRQRLLRDVRDDRFRLAFLAEIGQQQQYPRQAFLAG